MIEEMEDHDTRYGVVIVAAFFTSYLIIDGTRFTFGIYFVELLAEFGRGRGETAMVGSFLSGTYNLGGPIYAFTVHRLGCRISAMLGSMVSTSGFLLSFVAPNLHYLIFTFGCMQGIGYGLLVMSGTVAVGKYFVTNRSLAIGIGMCGSGVGTLILPPVIRHVIDQLTWRGSMFIMASIALQGCVLGALYRSKNDVIEEQHEHGVHSCAEDGPEHFDKSDNGEIDTYKCVQVDAYADSQFKYDKPNNLAHYIPVFTDESNCDTNSSKPIQYGMNKAASTENVNGVRKDMEKVIDGELQSLSKTSESFTHELERRSLVGNSYSCFPKVANKGGITVGSNDSFKEIALDLETDIEQSLDVNSCEISLTKHHADVTVEPESNESKVVSKFSNAFIENTFPKVLLSDVRLEMVMAAACLFGMTSVVPLTIVPDYALEVGCSSSQATWLLSAIGIGSTIGRAGSGLVADLPCSNRRVMLRVSFLMCGVLTMLCSILTKFGTLVVYALLYGVFVGATFTLQTVVNMDLFGARFIAQLMGMQMLAYGVSQLIGTTVAGLLHDETGDYRMSFLFGGGTCLLATLVHTLIYCVHCPRITSKSATIV